MATMKKKEATQDAQATQAELFEEYEGPPPGYRYVPGRPYGWAMGVYNSELEKTESIVVLDLSAGQQSTFASRAMGIRCLVRTVKGSGAQHARMTRGVLGSNHFDINPNQIRDPLHRSTMGGYQALVDREVRETGDLDLLKNFDADGKRTKYVIQSEYSNSINATLFELKKKDPSDEMAAAVNDVQSWLVDEMRYNPPK